MSGDGRILVYGVLGFFGGIFFFYRGLSTLRLKRLIENMPTSKVRSIAMGMVEVYGEARPCNGRLRSPFSGSDCVYYRYTIEEYRRSGKSSRWVTVRKGQSNNCFYLKDDTGAVLVNPEGASIEIPMDNEYSSGWGNDPPHCVNAFMIENGISHDSFLGFNKKMRFREYYIAPGDPLYVMGTAAENPSADPERLDVGAEHVMITKANKCFYISDSPEKKILGSLRWRMLCGVYGGAALSVICLAFILFYLRMI